MVIYNTNLIRSNFGEVIEYLLFNAGNYILSEKEGLIRIGISDSEYYALYHNSKYFFVAFVKWSRVQREWRYNIKEDPRHIVYELSKFKF